LLDELCKQHNIPAISVSSIGNIIKMLKEERKLNHEYARQLEKLKRKQRKIDIKTKNQQNQENWYK
jgi:hypothetical protein